MHGRTHMGEWSATGRCLYLQRTTQHITQETYTHAPNGIRTHDPGNQVAEHLRLTLRGHRYRPIHTTCPANLILLDLIILIIFSEECMLWSPTLYNFLQPLVISSQVQTFCQALCCQTHSVCVLLLMRESTHVSHAYKTKGKIKVL
jgi:hypothetical protein